MTTADRNRRIQAVKLADALNAIKGVPVSDYAKLPSHRWINREIQKLQQGEYADACCEGAKESNFIPGRFAAPEAVAHLITQKIVMGSPLYQQEQKLKR